MINNSDEFLLEIMTFYALLVFATYVFSEKSSVANRPV